MASNPFKKIKRISARRHLTGGLLTFKYSGDNLTKEANDFCKWRKRIMKPADYLSLVRLIFGPITAFFLYLILKFPGAYPDLETFWSFKAFAIFYLVFLFTDWLDGRLAKKYGGTRFGAYLDPLADKALNWSYSAALVFTIGWTAFFTLFILFLGDAASTFERTWVYKKPDKNVKANYAGKLKMGFHSAAILFLLLTFVLYPETVFSDKLFWEVWPSGIGFLLLWPALGCAAYSLLVKLEQWRD
ncbi:MAG: CDP-alcohol phosphatidyltransferase family protein [Candidatus Niyogibacteria bacterium]|nr:MAG: CDP-alcohol phosphatidyltransferase family protein [Candidatus Niyogibacteria bacterium]